MPSPSKQLYLVTSLKPDAKSSRFSLGSAVGKKRRGNPVVPGEKIGN